MSSRNKRPRKTQSTIERRRQILDCMKQTMQMVPLLLDDQIQILLSTHLGYRYQQGMCTREQMICYLSVVLASKIVDA